MSLLAQWVALPLRILTFFYALGSAMHAGSIRLVRLTPFKHFQKHVEIKATYLLPRRVVRCHPWGGTGVENVSA